MQKIIFIFIAMIVHHMTTGKTCLLLGSENWAMETEREIPGPGISLFSYNLSEWSHRSPGPVWQPYICGLPK